MSLLIAVCSGFVFRPHPHNRLVLEFCKKQKSRALLVLRTHQSELRDATTYKMYCDLLCGRAVCENDNNLSAVAIMKTALFLATYHGRQPELCVFNPRRACTARVTVLRLSVCLSVCLCVRYN